MFFFIGCNGNSCSLNRLAVNASIAVMAIITVMVIKAVIKALAVRVIIVCMDLIAVTTHIFYKQ